MARTRKTWKPPSNYYKLFGIPYDATGEEIRLAYEEMLGKVGDVDTPEFMEAVTQGYEVLSDPEKRTRYDSELRAKGEWTPKLHEEVEDLSSDLEEEQEEEEVEAPEPESPPIARPEQGKRAWYVVHSYSGYENKVKKNLEHRIESMGMQDLIFRVVVPTEEEVELRDGQRKTTERRIFPGYILVEMIMTDDSWHVVRNTPGVTGFVGSVNEPTPLRPDEVDKILKRMEAPTPKVKVNLRPGHKVRIVEGPFADFMGTVEELMLDKGKVRILVSFFGRETPVELDFLQVEKI